MSFRINHTQTDLTAAEEAALAIIENERAVVKVVVPDPDYDYPLGQIADPDNNRPSRSTKFYKSKFDMDKPKSVLKMNPSNEPNTTSFPHLDPFAIHEHEFGKCHERVHGKEFTHTKKTAVSFLPADPRCMELFYSPGHVGLLWDIGSCDLKEGRYLFGDGTTAPWSDTDWCNWLDVRLEKNTDPEQSEYEQSRNTIDEVKAMHSTTVEEFRKINRQAVAEKKRLGFNEWLACLPKRKVDAVFHLVEYKLGEHFEDYRDTPVSRLKTWDYMLGVKKKLGLQDNIPVLIISDVTPVRVYTESDRNNDLQAVSSLTVRALPVVNQRAITSVSIFRQSEDVRTPEYASILEALAQIKSASLSEETLRDVQLALMYYITTSKNPCLLLKMVAPLMKKFGMERMYASFDDYLHNQVKFQLYCSEIKALQEKFPDEVVYDQHSFKEAIQKALSSENISVNLRK